MSKHTPGPWMVVPEGHRLSVWAEGYGFIHSHEAPEVNTSATETANANSTLIAKAPQLLEMLKTIIRAEFGRQDPLKFAPGTYWERAQRLINEIEDEAKSSPIES